MYDSYIKWCEEKFGSDDIYVKYLKRRYQIPQQTTINCGVLGKERSQKVALWHGEPTEQEVIK